MAEDLLEKALACFEPPLPAEKIPPMRERLLDIVERYRRASAEGPAPILPLRTLVWSEAAGGHVPESDDDYLARVKPLFKAPKKRGRPRNLNQDRLVAVLRNILMESGCHYGAPKNGRQSRLVRLAKLIDEMAGGPGKCVAWQQIAENAADPLWELRLQYGDGIQRDRSKDGLFRKATALALRKPPKRRA